MPSAALQHLPQLSLLANVLQHTEWCSVFNMGISCDPIYFLFSFLIRFIFFVIYFQHCHSFETLEFRHVKNSLLHKQNTPFFLIHSFHFLYFLGILSFCRSKNNLSTFVLLSKSIGSQRLWGADADWLKNALRDSPTKSWV